MSTFDELSPISTSTGAPLAVAFEWVDKVVATRRPTAAEWVEHSLVWRVTADEPIYTAVVLDTDDDQRYALLPADERVREVALHLHFARHRDGYTWPAEKEVRVALSGGPQTVVASEALWLDPREVVQQCMPSRLNTGTIATLASITAPRVRARTVFLGAEHVRTTHARWKADTTSLALPPDLQFLTEGRRSGRRRRDE